MLFNFFCTVANVNLKKKKKKKNNNWDPTYLKGFLLSQNIKLRKQLFIL